MSNFTTDLYELKREIVNYSQKLTAGVPKSTSKFIMDMIYGLAHSQSLMISNIARALNEDIKLNNTISRLCDNLEGVDDNTFKLVKDNYYNEIKSSIDSNPTIYLDDIDIVKPTAYKFEDLDKVRDGSSIDNLITKGYNVACAITISKNQKQPIPLYHKIYSTISDEFKSKNDETMQSIKTILKIFRKERLTFVCDRGYDSNFFHQQFINLGQEYIIRINKRRNLIFKNRVKNVGEIALRRKGKVKMKLYFQGDNREVYVSHTRVKLKEIAQELTLVIVYGLSEKEPLLLMSNKKVKNKEDVHNIVRKYFSRWKIEEYFRYIKQEYGYENMRVRSLKAMNCLSDLLMMHAGQVAIMADKIDRKLLIIKIIERSRSLKKKVYFWLVQISRGIKEILKYSQGNLEKYQKKERRTKLRQLSLDI